MSNISWNWRFATFGALMALIALCAIAMGEIAGGLYLLIGSIPSAIVGLAPKRKDRKNVLIVGLLFSISILLGSILAQWVVLAVVGMFIVSLGSARLAANKPLGLIALSVIMPLTGIGLTYTGVQESAVIALLFALGTVGSFAWAMVLPEYEGMLKPKKQLSSAVAKRYSLTLGLSAAISTAVGFGLGVEHVGWLVGSTLLVMQPTKDMITLRGAGRVISVFVGATLAAVMLLTDPSFIVIAIVSWLVLVAMTATSESRWYVTPAFTSYLILWALLYEEVEHHMVITKFGERVLDTVIGVAIAYAVGVLLPVILKRLKKSN